MLKAKALSPVRFVGPRKQLLERCRALGWGSGAAEQAADRLFHAGAAGIARRCGGCRRRRCFAGGFSGCRDRAVDAIEDCCDLDQFGAERKKVFIKDAIGLCHGSGLVGVARKRRERLDRNAPASASPPRRLCKRRGPAAGPVARKVAPRRCCRL